MANNIGEKIGAIIGGLLIICILSVVVAVTYKVVTWVIGL